MRGRVRTGNAKIIQQLAQHGADASLPATGGVTALHAAAEIGDAETVKALLKVWPKIIFAFIANMP